MRTATWWVGEGLTASTHRRVCRQQDSLGFRAGFSEWSLMTCGRHYLLAGNVVDRTDLYY